MSIFMQTDQLEACRQAWIANLEVRQEDLLELSAPALLVLDMQNEFLSETGQMPTWGGPAIIPGLQRLVSAFRQQERPVIYTRHICLEPFAHQHELRSMRHLAAPADFLRDGHANAELHAGFAPGRDEPVFVKYRYSAFYDTPLDTWLRARGVRETVLCGVTTNICCAATAQDAFFRRYEVVVPVDGAGGIDEVSHLAALRTIQLAYGRLSTVEGVVDALLSGRSE